MPRDDYGKGKGKGKGGYPPPFDDRGEPPLKRMRPNPHDDFGRAMTWADQFSQTTVALVDLVAGPPLSTAVHPPPPSVTCRPATCHLVTSRPVTCPCIETNGG
eukprot:CAMPEP_0174288996 /NCGR_PEP_ID=MMETSP0809-20121228/23162_1 /TAXON_ID=73025 ORGANISM="Eutreptiella gymnastica-like, Strain CCMP1594" /NCGR_SAMPLE_ID=MMETSP0809 /ASSEMBLY_ACC=CAM_ASM_000658 /LENGTH=102 /DNA_ID=CAMNT_0015386635 /DNA_START=36 /DNA_END=341 /DNA_ORIENTATION=+